MNMPPTACRCRRQAAAIRARRRREIPAARPTRAGSQTGTWIRQREAVTASARAGQRQGHSQRACRTALRHDGIAWKADISLAAHRVDRLEAAKDETRGIERNFT